MNRKHLAPDDRVSSALAKVLGDARPLALLFVLLVACTMIGCGTPGAPLPPSLSLPTPVVNLSAIRIANSVRLTWSMPTRTTDKVVLRHPIPVQICRAVESGPCAEIASLTLKPGGTGEYADALPANLTQGPDRLLRYEVALRNHAGKSAGPSNTAYSAAGTGPAALTGLTGQVRREGVLLNWHPATEPGQSILFRIERLQLTAADQAPKSALAPVAPAAAQTLEVQSKDGVDPGHAVDASALFNQQYRYVLERVATLALSGHSVEVQGLPSEAVVISTTDIFPQPSPRGWSPLPMRRREPSISPGCPIAIATWRLTMSTAATCIQICRPSASLPWAPRPHFGIPEHNPNMRMLTPSRLPIKVATRAHVPLRWRRLYRNRNASL